MILTNKINSTTILKINQKMKIERIIFVVLFLVALPGFVLAEDLSDYPDFFVDNGKLDVIIVVGDKASSSHALAQTQIALSLTNLIGKRVIGLTKLASEVDKISEVNIISIGNACDNDVSLEILGNPKPCDRGLESGKATIEFFQSGNSFHLVLNALSDKGIKKVADVMSNYESYNFIGNIFETVVFDEETVSNEGQEEKDEISIDEEKERVIDGLSKKIAEKEIDDETKKKDDEKLKIVQEKEENVLEEESKEKLKESQPNLTEKDNIIKMFISWLLSLFK